MNGATTTADSDGERHAAIAARVRRAAVEYAGDTGASASVIGEIDQLLEFSGSQRSRDASRNALKSKYTPIEHHQVLKYWIFDGLPLSTRLVFYFGVLEGLFPIAGDDAARWGAFADYMEEFRARETTLHASRDVGGWLFGGEAEALWNVGMKAVSLPGDYCELGAWLGRTTLIWCHALRRAASKKTLHVVDNWQWGNEGEKYPFMTEGRDMFLEFSLNLSGFEQWYQAHNGLIETVLPKLRPHLEREGLALLFHDAGHSYAEVKHDLTLYVPFLNDGAYLVVHDFNHPDFPEVREAVGAVERELGCLKLESTVNTLGIFRRTTA